MQIHVFVFGFELTTVYVAKTMLHYVSMLSDEGIL